MYTPQQLFIRAVDDLRSAVENPTERSLFDAVKPLRHLLTDGLLHQANRPFKMKLQFVIAPFSPGPIRDGLVFDGTLDGISPTIRPRKAKAVSLDLFLATPILELRGQTVTVVDLIRYLANYAGVIHKNPPNTPAMRTAEESATLVRSDDMPFALRAIRPICEVVIAACEPLYKACSDPSRAPA